MNANAELQTKSTNNQLNPWIIIGSFLIPILGIVLYFVFRKKASKWANSAILAAAVGIMVNLVILLTGNGVA